MTRVYALLLLLIVFGGFRTDAAEDPSSSDHRLPASAEEAQTTGRGTPPYARVRVAIPSTATGAGRQSAPGSAQGVSMPDTPASPQTAISPSSGALPETSRQTDAEGATPEPIEIIDLTQPAEGPREPKPPEPLVLASLDGEPITDIDVMRELWERRGRETLEWMIGRAVLEKELSRLGLDILDSEVEERLQQHVDSLRNAFPNIRADDDLTRAAAGMKLDEYRERSVWTELALRKIMRSALKPTDEQLRNYYAERQADFIQPERVRLSQVFIAPQADSDDDLPGPADWALAEKQILEAHTRLRMGEDFATVARAYGSGGQLSRWAVRGELLRELEETAFSLRPGSFSTPLKSGVGYHIIRVEEKRERNQPKFEEIRNEAQAQYEEKLFVLMAGEFMTRLREKAIKNGGLVIADNPDIFPQTE